MTLILSSLMSLIYTAFHFYDRAVSQTTALLSMTQQKEQAEFASLSMAAAIEKYNQIAGVALNEQLANRTSSLARQTFIKTVLRPIPCAAVFVPDPVNDSLLSHYHHLRQSTGHADPGKPSGVLPALGTAQ